MTGRHELGPGSRLSHYEIVELLGRGAMGEVWRARDTRLGRDVALKTLREGTAEGSALRAIEREARAVSALSHPNIVTVLDVEVDAEPPFLVLELVAGRTLADLALHGPIPPAKALDLAAQVAAGLAAAHAAGLVHRDLKPANVVVTRDGCAKILDFGLARLERPALASPTDATLPGPSGATRGALVGTAAYMSPEQASGALADSRSDQFALGVILHELLSGHRAFHRPTLVETLAAILNEEPEPVPPLPAPLDAPTRWVLARCLAKDPDERYGSTGDLARDLRELASLAAGRAPGPAHARRAGRLLTGRRAAAAGVAVAIAAAGFAGGLLSRRGGLPSFRQLTFQRGTVWNARFTPGGDGIVYGASWVDSPARVFSTLTHESPSVRVGTVDATLLAVSASGELAVALDARPWLSLATVGTVARMPLTAGAPRPVVEGGSFADYLGASNRLVVVRRTAGRSRLEADGKVLFETAGWLSHPRASPDGRLVALLHHPVVPDDGGDVVVVPVAGGEPRVLAPGWASAAGLAWGPGGEEVWFTATGETGGRALRAVSLRGRLRTIYRMPGNATLHDVGPGGTALLAHDTMRIGAVVDREGEPERDVSWLDATLLTDLSADATSLLFTEFGEGGGARYSALLRPSSGGPAVTLGSGFATALSPDGRRVLTIVGGAPPSLALLPTGAGPAAKAPMAPVVAPSWAAFLGGDGALLLSGYAPGGGTRLWLIDGPGAPARPVSPEGVDARFSAGVPSPDRRSVAVATDDGALLVCPLDGSPPRRLAEAPRGLVPIAWDEGSRSLLAFFRDGSSARVLKVDAGTGRATPLRVVGCPDPAGVIGIPTVRCTPDGRVWAWSCARLLSELYVVEGLK